MSKFFLTSRFPISMALCCGLFASSFEAWAGPKELKENLTFQERGPRVADAASGDERAFYYSRGKKIYLNNTGLTVVKSKEGFHDKMTIAKATLATGSPLKSVERTLELRGMSLISSTGPTGMSPDAVTERYAAEVSFALPVVEPESTGPDSTPMIMTEYIATKFDPKMTAEQVKEFIQPIGLKITRKQKYVPNGFILELADGPVNYTRLLKAANQLYEKGVPEKIVRYSFPDFITPAKAQFTPADPSYGQQWHLKNNGQGNGLVGADVNAPGAWAVTRGKKEVIIAIVDDSFEKDHPDLKDNYVAGIYVKSDGTFGDDPSPKDGTQRHGTACAGVAAACSNGNGGLGIAPECGLAGVHFFDNSQPSALADAFYACDSELKASILSCSWSWGFAFDSVSDAIRDLYLTGRNGKGTIILFAAANDYGEISHHQDFGILSEVIVVGATNWQDDHSAYSNYGPALCVVAPSNDVDTPGAYGILTSDNTEVMPKVPNRNYSGYINGNFTPGNSNSAAFGGTSSATPLVAGIAGLILSANPDLTASEVRRILQDTAVKIPGGPSRTASYVNGHDQYYGYGRVNAGAAVLRAQALIPQAGH